jgi:FKBP-type peptidyl-prolyl cis-trans isomerase
MKIKTCITAGIIITFSAFTTACNNSSSAAKIKEVVVAPAPISSLVIDDVKVGTGDEAKSGQTVSVHYTGWLYDANAADKHGKQFDSSRTRGTPFNFPLGAGRVIKGWDQGVAGMKVGGQRTLTIPSALGYGARGAGGSIPPNAVLVFDVELIGVK